jgi:hypothetical protein
MKFIHTLKVMYEMQHPQPQVSLASTIVDDENTYIPYFEKSVKLNKKQLDDLNKLRLQPNFEDQFAFHEDDEGNLIFDPEPELFEDAPIVPSLAPTVIDERDSLDLALETQEEPQQTLSQCSSHLSLDLDLDLTQEEEKEEDTIMEQKLHVMNETYDDLDLLSDNEELEEEVVNENQISVNPETYELVVEPVVEPVVVELVVEPVVDDVNELTEQVENLNIDAPPLPPNLSTSPMPIVEEIVEVVINYKKMKVKELKAECKKRGIKGYSKLKKKQLIELLQ